MGLWDTVTDTAEESKRAALGFWEKFSLGAGCLVSPIDCGRIQNELERIREKVDRGLPISQAEKDWVESGQAELEQAARETAQTHIHEPIEDLKQGLTTNLLWPAVFLLGVVIASR